MRAQFPTATDREAAWLEALRRTDLAESWTVSIGRLQRQLAYAASQRSAPTLPVNQQPPIVLTSERPPTEVIETRGAPAYDAIAGTNASYVSNTDSDVLRDDASGHTYALLSPGWFRALTLGGPRTYVAGRDVPASIRQIPRDHREARVLLAIPGTPEAEFAATTQCLRALGAVRPARSARPRLGPAHDPRRPRHPERARRPKRTSCDG